MAAFLIENRFLLSGDSPFLTSAARRWVPLRYASLTRMAALPVHFGDIAAAADDVYRAPRTWQKFTMPA